MRVYFTGIGEHSDCFCSLNLLFSLVFARKEKLKTPSNELNDLICRFFLQSTPKVVLNLHDRLVKRKKSVVQFAITRSSKPISQEI